MENNKECSFSKCIAQCDGRLLVASLVAFLPLFAFDLFYHSMILMPTYEASSLWRSEVEMLRNFPWEIAKQVGLSFVLTWIFFQHFENKGIGEGLRFGLATGLLMGLVQFGNYPYLPISLDLAECWLIRGIMEGIIVGCVLALVGCMYAKRSAKPSV